MEETNEGRPSEDEGNEASHDPASAKAGSPKGMDRRGNSRSSIKAHQGDKRDSYGTAGPRDPGSEPCRSRSAEVVLTTLHTLPRTEREEQRGSGGRMLPNLKTQSKVSAKWQKVSFNERESKKKKKKIVINHLNGPYSAFIADF